MIIVPNDGDGDKVEWAAMVELWWAWERGRESAMILAELQSGLSCDGDEGERQRQESEEEAESDWESEGPEGFVSGLFNQNALNDAVLGKKKKKKKKKRDETTPF